jgi:hypothetical protein
MADPVIYDYDGFEDYLTAGLLREHYRLAGSPTIETGGRHGGSWLKCPKGSAVTRVIPGSPVTTLWVGGYFRADGMPSGGGGILDFRDPTHSQVVIALNGDGSLSAFCSAFYGNADLHSGTFLGVSSPGVVQDGTPFFLQVGVTVDPTVGAVTIIVDNVTVLTLTGVATQNTSGFVAPLTTTITNVTIGSVNSGVSEGGGWYGPTALYLDDFWATAGPLGDRKVISIFPTAQGTYDDATPSTPGDHFPMVNEAPEPDDPATYVTLGDGQRETYLFETFALASGESVSAVLEVVDGRKTVEGPATVEGTMRVSGADYDGPDLALPTVSTGLWARRKRLWQNSPATGVPWAAATELNPPEAGIVELGLPE